MCGVKNYCVVRLCVCAAKFDGREIFLSVTAQSRLELQV